MAILPNEISFSCDIQIDEEDQPIDFCAQIKLTSVLIDK